MPTLRQGQPTFSEAHTTPSCRQPGTSGGTPGGTPGWGWGFLPRLAAHSSWAREQPPLRERGAEPQPELCPGLGP